MRKISPNVEFLLSQPVIKSFYLISIVGTNINIKYTTNFYDLDIPGLGLFTSNNSLSKFDPPLIEKATDRETYKFTFTDSNFDLRSTAEENIIGSRASLYMGLINTTENILGGANPEAPLLNLEDITLGFDGVIDGKQYTIDIIEQTAIFTIECSTPMASLEAKLPYITSKDAIQNLDPTDTCYDQIYEGSVAVGLLWGKE
jgi:hypothetical protein